MIKVAGMDAKNTEFWEELSSLYEQVEGLSDNERSEYLDTHCQNEAVRAELESLLAVHDSSLEYFDSLAAGLISPALEELSDPQLRVKRAGNYRIITELGRGGMGTVYLGERADDAYESRVAIKILRRGMDSDDILARFRIERQILARLNHPNITHLLDGGITEDGRPYFVMEYIQGQPITDYCDEKRLSVRQRLKLFLQICDALQYAHQNLVIHRDLKPGNILVTDDGQVKLLDFGIAKVISDDFFQRGATTLTREHQIVFTPEYASPEQIEGSRVNTSSDIYSLGIILYEMLTGRRPYSLKGLSRVQMADTLYEIIITRPSTVIKSSSGADKPGDEVDDIILKALRLEPEQRYDSVQQLAQDILNYLNNLPVMARADSQRYRLVKFMQRNRVAVALSLFTSFLLLTGMAGIVWQANKTQREAERALAATERAIAVKNFLVSMITAANPWVNPGATPTVRDLIEQGAQTVNAELKDQPALAAELLGVIGASYQGMREDSLARHYLESSLNLIDSGAVLEPLTTANIKADYAGALLRSGRPAEAESLANATIPEFNNLRNSTAVHSQLLSMRANAQGLLGKPAEALGSAKEAANLVCENTDLYLMECINAQMELRHFYEWAGDFNSGLDAAAFAYKLADSAGSMISDPMRLAVVGSYGNALSYGARTAEAIPLLEENAALALNLFGDGAYRYARALHDLATAHLYAGDLHIAYPMARRVFEIGGRAQPGNPTNAYWLYQIYRIALDLRMPDQASSAFNEFSDDLPETMSDYYVHAFKVERLRARVLSKPGDAGIRDEIHDMLENFRNLDSPLYPKAALLAAEQAVEANDTSAVKQYLNQYHASIEAIPRTDIGPARSMLINARYLALLGETEQAIEEAGRSLSALQGIGHTDSPFVAEVQAVLANLNCSLSDMEKGKAQLLASYRYWTEIAKVPAGSKAMDRLAPACTR